MPLSAIDLSILDEIDRKPLPERISTLLHALGNPSRKAEFKDEAVLRLQQIGAPAVGALVAALDTTVEDDDTDEGADRKNREEIRQMYAARALGGIGKAAADAVRKLQQLFSTSTRAFVKKESVLALARIGAAPSSTTNAETVFQMVNALNAAKDNWHEDIRAGAAEALGALGAEAKNAVPTLMNCLMDRVDRVRESALRALIKIGPGAIAALIHTLKNRDPIRWSAYHSASLQVDLWMKHFDHEAIRDEFFFNRVTAARNDFWFLSQLREQQQLVEMIFDGAIRVLGQVGNRSTEARDVLQDVVATDANARLRTIAEEVLRQM